MPRRLLLAATALAAAFVAGCAAKPVQTVRTVVEVCPAELPRVPCPDWPAGAPATLLDLEAAHAQGKAAHAACQAAVGAWRAARRACAKED